ncbi:MAG: ABC transporter ATP-binding protein [Lachnospiraceae bacterium]|nr:ABC transporter ATP-binding protein [Lachnospiraceae bacterium]
MIDINEVSYTYHVTDAEGNDVYRNVLKDFSLKINKGELVVLTGGSGCGKTTIIRLINGLIPNYFDGELKGEVTVAGMVVNKQPVYETAAKVGTVFQNPKNQFFNVDTTSELAFAAENRGTEPEEILKRIDKVCDRMDLFDLMDRSMFNLSGGEKQRIACASIAVTDPDVVVLDEPTSNLDDKGIKDLREILIKWKRQGKTIVIAEHRLYFLKELADKVYVLNEGKVVKELSGKEFDSLSLEETASLKIRAVDDSFKKKFGDEDLSALLKTKGAIDVKDLDFKYSDGVHGIKISDMALPKNSLIAIVGNNGRGKSTFARCLCGLNKKAKGKVDFEGKEISINKMTDRCFMVMQDVNHQLFTESVKDEIMLSIDSKDEETCEKKAREAMEVLDISSLSELHPMSLSGGQKQRVAIACAIASDKDIIILDEPTSGLDYYHMVEVAEVLKKLVKLGKTVVVITHDTELIDECAQCVVKLKKYLI